MSLGKGTDETLTDGSVTVHTGKTRQLDTQEGFRRTACGVSLPQHSVSESHHWANTTVSEYLL